MCGELSHEIRVVVGCGEFINIFQLFGLYIVCVCACGSLFVSSRRSTLLGNYLFSYTYIVYLHLYIYTYDDFFCCECCQCDWFVVCLVFFFVL